MKELLMSVKCDVKVKCLYWISTQHNLHTVIGQSDSTRQKLAMENYSWKILEKTKIFQWKIISWKFGKDYDFSQVQKF